mmetsp:Transcript_52691/g.120077  ORF Transcript_52691/g.120077 Transcript_52691/m.120077 type:complete len:291 (-) Transcript_52691:1463-2335(-)
MAPLKKTKQRRELASFLCKALVLFSLVSLVALIAHLLTVNSIGTEFHEDGKLGALSRPELVAIARSQNATVQLLREEIEILMTQKQQRGARKVAKHNIRDGSTPVIVPPLSQTDSQATAGVLSFEPPPSASAQATSGADSSSEHEFLGAQRTPAFTPSKLSSEDWLIYLRIQKTGSQTFLNAIRKEFRPWVWGNKRVNECPERNFCGGPGKNGKTCADVVAGDAASIGRERGCKFLFRGHINVLDYNAGLRRAFPAVKRPAVKFITFLREPMARCLSEFSHVTEGLVAQV